MVLRRPRNYPSRAKERVGRGCIVLSPELTVGGEGACQTGFVASDPELSVGGERARRTGLDASAPELSVGGEERVGRDGLRLPHPI